MKSTFTYLFTFILFLFFTQLINAQIYKFDIMLDGAQASAGTGTGSAGTGSGEATYDKSTMTLSISNGTFTGLTGTTSAAHVHQAPAGANGGVTFGLTFTSGATSGTFSGSHVLDAGEETALFADGMYINIHTSEDPGGEIRGQIILETTHIFDINLDGAQAAAGGGTGSAGTGTGKATYSTITKELCVDGTFTGLTGTTTSAHVHQALAGANGGVTFGLTFTSGATSGTFSGSHILDAGEETALLADGMYVNIHTSEDPGGEIRGQIGLSAALPVELSQFIVKEIDDKKVRLYWETLSESNSAYFIIERSTGNSFEELGRITSAGFSNEPIDYNFMDESPIENKISYYRLKQVDLDDKFAYSPIESIFIKNSSDETVRVFPNVIQGNRTTTFEINSVNKGQGQLKVISSNGLLIREFSMNILAGKNQLELNFNNFSIGNYYIVFEKEGQRNINKIIIL